MGPRYPVGYGRPMENARARSRSVLARTRRARPGEAIRKSLPPLAGHPRLARGIRLLARVSICMERFQDVGQFVAKWLVTGITFRGVTAGLHGEKSADHWNHRAGWLISR